MTIYDDIKIAEKDIICYRIFEVEDIFAKKTPLTYPKSDSIICQIKNHIWYVGEENKVFHDKDINYYKVNGIVKEFNDGWFYTIEDKNFAKYNLSKVNYFFEHKTLVVCKCIIPRGSKYVKGIEWYDFAQIETYASDKLTIIEILK